RTGLNYRARGVGNLGKGLIRFDQVGSQVCQARSVRSNVRGDDLRARTKSGIDRVQQRLARIVQDEDSDRDQDGGSADGENEGEAQPDRNSLHGFAPEAVTVRSRYPEPRTVSIDSTPKGRSIFSRRYRT